MSYNNDRGRRDLNLSAKKLLFKLDHFGHFNIAAASMLARERFPYLFVRFDLSTQLTNPE